MYDMQPVGKPAGTQITDLNPGRSTRPDEGPIFALQGEIPDASFQTRAGYED